MATHLIIAGVVQGVGYRASFEAQARALKLAGWVRNRSDGSVEAVVHGEPQALQQIIDWAWRGPSLARVTTVSATNVDDTSLENGGFRVLPTK